MKYTESHEWIEVDGETGTVGITDFAQGELGDIVYVELPEIGKTLDAGDEVAVLESTKAAADIYSPVTGQIIEVNDQLELTPELINHSPMEGGWIFKIKLLQPSEMEKLLDTAPSQ